MTIDDPKNTAAAHLEGLTLNNGWKVRCHIHRGANASGGFFSHSYIVERDGRSGFLKAFDFSEAFEPNKDTIAFLSALTSAYEHEREVLQICKERRLSNVVIAIDHGQTQVPTFDKMTGRVFYLIFELADGDIRGQVDQTKRFPLLWSVRALKDVCLGLWQVHREMIAHQDMKPSNVLIYSERFRISDFGRSSRKGHSVWYDNERVAGDRSYSPPELLYGFLHPDFVPRRIGCDLYMLGNLAAFMFAGVNMTASLMLRLDRQFHYLNWHGTYDEVLPYVREAFTRVLEDLNEKIAPEVNAEIIPMIRQLCDPDLTRRGHPKGIGRRDQYSLERFVSQFDILCRQVELHLRIGRKTV